MNIFLLSSEFTLKQDGNFEWKVIFSKFDLDFRIGRISSEPTQLKRFNPLLQVEECILKS